MAGLNFQYASMDVDGSEQDLDGAPPPATYGSDHLRRPHPLPLHQGGASQLTGSLSSTTTNDSLRPVRAHSARMSRSPTRGSAVTKHSVRQWARTRVQRLGSKFGSVITSVGSSSSRNSHTGDDTDASKPQSYPDPKTTAENLRQSPFKASFASIGRKKGHQRAVSDPNISLPQPIRLTNIKSPQERARDATMMDEFKFEWAKACRPGITMQDLRPNSQPYRSPGSEAMESAYAAFRRKSGSTGASGSSSNRSHGHGVSRMPARTVPEEPSSRQTVFAGDSRDYFSQHRPDQPENAPAEYAETWARRSPGGNPLTTPYIPEGSPPFPEDSVRRSPARTPNDGHDRYKPVVSSPLSPRSNFHYGAFRDSGLIGPVPHSQPYAPIVRPARGRGELSEREIRVRDNTALLHDRELLNESQKAVQKTYYMRDHPSPPVAAIQQAPELRHTRPDGPTSTPTHRRADSGVRLTMPKDSWYSNMSGFRTPEDVPEENTPPAGTPQTSKPSTLRSDSLRTICSKQGRDCSNCGDTDIFPPADFQYERGDLRPPFRRPDEDVDFDVEHEGGKKRVVSQMHYTTTPDSLMDIMDMWKKELQFDPSATPVKVKNKAVHTFDVDYNSANVGSERASMRDPAATYHGESAAWGKENTNVDKPNRRGQSTVSNATDISILKPLAYNPNRPSQPVVMPPHNVTWDEAARATGSRSRSRSRSRTRSSTQALQHPPGYNYHSPLEQWSVKHREFLDIMHRRPEFMKSKDEEDEWKAFISSAEMRPYLEDPVPAPVKKLWEKFVAWQRELGEYPVETTEGFRLEQPPPSNKEGKGKEKVAVPDQENFRPQRGLEVAIPPPISQYPEYSKPGEASGSTSSNKGNGKATESYEESSRCETRDTIASEYVNQSDWDTEPEFDRRSNDGYNLAYYRPVRQETATEQYMSGEDSDHGMIQDLNRRRSTHEDDDERLVPRHKKYVARYTPTIEQLHGKLQQLRTAAEVTPPPAAEKKNYKAITARHVAKQARLREMQDEYSPLHNNVKAHNQSPAQPIERYHDANFKVTRRVSKFSRPKCPTTAMITGSPWTHTTHPTGLSLISAEPFKPLFNRPRIPLIIPSAALRKGDKLFTAAAPSEIQYYHRTSTTEADTHCAVHILSMGTMTPSHSTILRNRGMARATIRYLKLIILDYRTLDGLTTLVTWDPEAAENSTPRVVELYLVASHVWSMEFFVEAMRLAKEKAEGTAIGAAYGFAQVWVAKGMQGQEAWYVLGWAEPGQCMLTRATGVAFDGVGARCVKYRRFCAGMKGMRGMTEVEEGDMRAMEKLYGECGICGETEEMS